MTAASTAIRSLAAFEANVNVKVKPAEIAAINPFATKAEPNTVHFRPVHPELVERLV